MDTNLEEEIGLWQEKLFSRSIRRSRNIDCMLALIGNTANFHCLEISSGDGMASIRLRSLGGSWKTAAVNTVAADSLNYSIKDNIIHVQNGTLPFEDHTFDRVVVVDALKHIKDPHGFIRECHRVLKPDSWVVISEERRVTFGIVALLQRLLSLSPVAKGALRNGYKHDELFNILKDGFDVPAFVCLSNGLLESALIIGEFIRQRIMPNPYWLIPQKTAEADLYRYRRLFGLASAVYPLLWILSKMEFLPGHKLLVKSRRRRWRPRLQPVLLDGRSIAEAAINTKIGTAAPF